MLLTPRYDGPAVLRFTGPIPDLSVPLLRQRRRLAHILSDLPDAQWARASRCESWSVRDVVAHLIDTDRFWVAAVTAALAGTPTRFLAAFDPVVTPALLVERMQDLAPAEVLASYAAGVEALAEVLSGLDETQWSVPAEAPPGHVPLHAMTRHALWDAWVHERDIVLPLGLVPVEEPDEMRACLQYVAALGPALVADDGSTRVGTLVFEGVEPPARVVVAVDETVVVSDQEPPAGAVRISGRTVDLIEALSLRVPFPDGAADRVAAGDRWLLSGLARAFDAVPEG